MPLPQLFIDRAVETLTANGLNVQENEHTPFTLAQHPIDFYLPPYDLFVMPDHQHEGSRTAELHLMLSTFSTSDLTSQVFRKIVSFSQAVIDAGNTMPVVAACQDFIREIRDTFQRLIMPLSNTSRNFRERTESQAAAHRANAQANRDRIAAEHGVERAQQRLEAAQQATYSVSDRYTEQDFNRDVERASQHYSGQGLRQQINPLTPNEAYARRSTDSAYSYWLTPNTAQAPSMTWTNDDTLGFFIPAADPIAPDRRTNITFHDPATRERVSGLDVVESSMPGSRSRVVYGIGADVYEGQMGNGVAYNTTITAGVDAAADGGPRTATGRRASWHIHDELGTAPFPEPGVGRSEFAITTGQAGMQELDRAMAEMAAAQGFSSQAWQKYIKVQEPPVPKEPEWQPEPHVDMSKHDYSF